MELKIIEHRLSVCKVSDLSDIDLTADLYFVGKTDEEISLVCKTEDIPTKTIERDDGWRGFRIQGVLDFSLIGILSKLSGILAEHKIGIFAVSTYNTDYILVKEANFNRALEALASEGYFGFGIKKMRRFAESHPEIAIRYGETWKIVREQMEEFIKNMSVNENEERVI